MNNLRTAAQNLIPAALRKVSRRTRWSLIDQALVSGVNLLTGVLIVRALGIQEFGIFSVVLIGMQFLAGFQAGINMPMMSLFDQRGSVSRSSYLATVLLHQSVLAAASATVVCVLPVLFPAIATFAPVDVLLVAAAVVATQFQDHIRRFFYVSERPVRAFLSDLIAYGARLAVLTLLAVQGELTIDRVWIVMAVFSTAAAGLLLPDFIGWAPVWSEVREVTRRHLKVAGWIVGNNFTAWFVEASFILLVVGAVLGPVQLGAARAVQSIVQLANLLIESLENFVPSAATKTLIEGGPRALLHYVERTSASGGGAILLMAVTLMIFADPILMLVYGQPFENAVAIIAIFGAAAALSYVASVINAGLRALVRVRASFFAQAAVGVGALLTAWPAAEAGGVLGALTVLLVARAALTAQLAVLLYRRVSDVPAPVGRAAAGASHAAPAPTRLVVTTSWDDGDPASLRIAELLSKYGAKGTFYVPNRNSEGRPVMTESQVREVARSFEVGGHSIDHVVLTRVRADEAARQIVENKQWLEQLTGARVEGFAYVQGRYDRSVKELVRRAGFDYARTVENLQPGIASDPFEVPTTIQFFPHGRDVYLRNFLRKPRPLVRAKLLCAALAEADLSQRVSRLVDVCARTGGCFHLWGHAWEIEEQNLWSELEDVFKRLADGPATVVFATNREALHLTR